MTRPLRIQFEGAFYHATVRENTREDFCRNGRDASGGMAICASPWRRRMGVSPLWGIGSVNY